jgi:glutathione S-transferase
MSDIDLYYISGSPPCWRVMLAMEVKGIPYRPVRLDNSKQEQKSPEFLAINPNGTVPVLVSEAATVRDSIAILAYLDAAWTEPPMFGSTAAETGAIWQEIFDFESSYPKPIQALSRPLFRGKAEEQAEAIRLAAKELRETLIQLDRKLAQQTHFVDNSLTAADIVAYPPIMALARACGRDDALALGLDIMPFSQHMPAVARWVERMEALPGHDKAYPPHWKQAAE